MPNPPVDFTTLVWISWLVLAGAVLTLAVTKLDGFGITAVLLAWCGGVVTHILLVLAREA